MVLQPATHKSRVSSVDDVILQSGNLFDPTTQNKNGTTIGYQFIMPISPSGRPQGSSFKPAVRAMNGTPQTVDRCGSTRRQAQDKNRSSLAGAATKRVPVASSSRQRVRYGSDGVRCLPSIIRMCGGHQNGARKEKPSSPPDNLPAPSPSPLSVSVIVDGGGRVEDAQPLSPIVSSQTTPGSTFCEAPSSPNRDVVLLSNSSPLPGTHATPSETDPAIVPRTTLIAGMASSATAVTAVNSGSDLTVNGSRAAAWRQAGRAVSRRYGSESQVTVTESAMGSVSGPLPLQAATSESATLKGAQLVHMHGAATLPTQQQQQQQPQDAEPVLSRHGGGASVRRKSKKSGASSIFPRASTWHPEQYDYHLAPADCEPSRGAANTAGRAEAGSTGYIPSMVSSSSTSMSTGATRDAGAVEEQCQPGSSSIIVPQIVTEAMQPCVGGLQGTATEAQHLPLEEHEQRESKTKNCIRASGSIINVECQDGDLYSEEGEHVLLATPVTMATDMAGQQGGEDQLVVFCDGEGEEVEVMGCMDAPVSVHQPTPASLLMTGWRTTGSGQHIPVQQQRILKVQERYHEQEMQQHQNRLQGLQQQHQHQHLHQVHQYSEQQQHVQQQQYPTAGHGQKGHHHHNPTQQLTRIASRRTQAASGNPPSPHSTTPAPITRVLSSKAGLSSSAANAAGGSGSGARLRRHYSTATSSHLTSVASMRTPRTPYEAKTPASAPATTRSASRRNWQGEGCPTPATTRSYSHCSPSKIELQRTATEKRRVAGRQPSVRELRKHVSEPSAELDSVEVEVRARQAQRDTHTVQRRGTRTLQEFGKQRSERMGGLIRTNTARLHVTAREFPRVESPVDPVLTNTRRVYV